MRGGIIVDWDFTKRKRYTLYIIQNQHPKLRLNNPQENLKKSLKTHHQDIKDQKFHTCIAQLV